MEISLSQVIGLISVALLIAIAIGTYFYLATRTSYIYKRSIKTAVIWAITGLVVQSFLLLAISTSS